MKSHHAFFSTSETMDLIQFLQSVFHVNSLKVKSLCRSIKRFMHYGTHDVGVEQFSPGKLPSRNRINGNDMVKYPLAFAGVLLTMKKRIAG